MPGLPNPGLRWIPDAKVRDYLLSSTTEKGRSRLKFFQSHGFSQAGWPVLCDALMAHALTASVEIVRQDQWGITYCATGSIVTPDGRNPVIRAFWIIRPIDPRPQLTSVLPG
ncbi:hypothetical protein M0638_27275 [Roseomonas sp. NAR14]|uniref:DUF6883 domain-containing protein n=1 Tax=Roseomonas acroporae TaxID=2937791 RepID=A0A9X1YE02_9PROT|nr:DUF6883 domain-containing protein [Roseomonas acroporae]MCK8788062.1 hypothetical protein [Roseomonas acroporae]